MFVDNLMCLLVWAGTSEKHPDVFISASLFSPGSGVSALQFTAVRDHKVFLLLAMLLLFSVMSFTFSVSPFN